MTAVASTTPLVSKVFNATVIVTALGYFVDLFDYYIFLVSRVQVLKDFGLSGDALTETGLYLVNLQFAGMLVGGLVFGILGDKIGRKKGLLASILIYSLATLFSGLTHNLDVFAALRFLAGFGIAGEVGVGVTLIAEVMDKEKRGLGITFFGALGVMGVVVAALAAEFLPWRTCYIIGGVVGLCLLVTRALVVEPDMYRKIGGDAARGSLKLIFLRWQNLKKFVLCMLLGAPVFFGVSIVMTLSPELAAGLGVTDPVRASIVIAIGYLAMTLGEIAVGLLSQRLKSRKRVIGYALVVLAAVVAVGFSQSTLTLHQFYLFAALVGFFMGYWVNYIALAAEQFGTNLRATTATSIPNFARALVIPINYIFLSLKDGGVVFAASVVAVVTIGVALLVIRAIPETFGSDLDYVDK